MWLGYNKLTASGPLYIVRVHRKAKLARDDVMTRCLGNDFSRLAEIPRLRRYARALISDGLRADECNLRRAVAKQYLWQPGTSLRPTIHIIFDNQHVNEVHPPSAKILALNNCGWDRGRDLLS